MAQRIIYWFRNDLRLHDNEALFNASKSANEIVPVYVFDLRQFEKTRLGFRRTGALRAQFLIESVIDLRNRLREKGGDLLIRIGEPEKIIAQLAEDYAAEYVFTSKEIAPEETRIESSLSKNLKLANVDIKLYWMDTLLHAVDLPFSISKLPPNFTEFSDRLKDHLTIKGPFPEAEEIILPQEFEAGSIPSLPALGIDPNEISQTATSLKPKLPGGETTALTLLNNYIQTYIKGKQRFETNDPLTDTRLSDWLSLGCISARYIYDRVKSAQSGNVSEEQMLHNLLARDFFHWTLLRYGPRMFKPSGVKHEFSKRWSNDNDIFAKWINGQTSDTTVNTIIQKLNSEGYLTSMERETASRFLVDELGINWTWGAMYFESHLTDYEASVNWGRWNNIAGVGEV
jgi:deoxyribodipyrimidine photo-lyase